MSSTDQTLMASVEADFRIELAQIQADRLDPPRPSRLPAHRL